MSLKILHLSAANAYSGAGIACLNLHNELLRQGIDSKVLFLKNNGYQAEGIFYFDNTLLNKIIQKFLTFFDRGILFMYVKRKAQLFSANIFGINLWSHTLIKDADVIHLHWINHGFISNNSLLKFKKPMLFTMHDTWLFTGGCHYFFNCRRFEKACGQCPTLNSSHQMDLSYQVLARKKEIFNRINYQLVAISHWMKNAAQSSTLFKDKEINVISSAIDIDFFYLKDTFDCRKEFNFSLREKIILIGAQEIDSPYKGIGLAVEALEKFTSFALTIVTFGNGGIAINNSLHKVINLGFISSKDKMASLYAASDLFFAPSLAEGFGMAVAEAQACGTPVLAFQNTGPEDIVQHQISGYLAQYEDSSDLISGLNYCLHAEFDYKKFSANARSKFSIAKTAEAYKNIYYNFLTNNASI
jgi:glycosyltransferase involved in cell wall biosynthesis